MHTFKDKSVNRFHTLAALIFTGSLFLPNYGTAAVIILLGILVLFHGERSRVAFADLRAKVIMGFCPATGLVAVIYRNYQGALFSLFLFVLFALVFYLRSGMTRRLFHMMLDLVCAGSLLAVVIAIIQKLVMLPVSPDYRPMAMLSNANYYGMFIQFAVLIAMYRMFHCTGRRKFYAAVIGANLVGLYLTASMSSFAALACASLVFLLLKGKVKPAFCLIGAITLFLIAVAIFPDIFPRVDMIDHTMGQRMNIWTTSLEGIEKHPIFGQGPMTYLHICDSLGGYHTIHSHNLFLDTLLNYGLMGSLVIFFCAISQMRVIVSRLRRNICTSMNLLILAGLAAILIHGLSDVTILSVQAGPLFLLLCTSMGVQAEERRPVVAVVQIPELEPLRRMRARYGRSSSSVYSIKR